MQAPRISYVKGIALRSSASVRRFRIDLRFFPFFQAQPRQQSDAEHFYEKSDTGTKENGFVVTKRPENHDDDIGQKQAQTNIEGSKFL